MGGVSRAAVSRKLVHDYRLWSVQWRRSVAPRRSLRQLGSRCARASAHEVQEGCWAARKARCSALSRAVQRLRRVVVGRAAACGERVLPWRRVEPLALRASRRTAPAGRAWGGRESVPQHFLWSCAAVRHAAFGQVCIDQKARKWWPHWFEPSGGALAPPSPLARQARAAPSPGTLGTCGTVVGVLGGRVAAG